MKKIVLILVTVFLNVGLFSFTPQAISEEMKSKQASGGEDGYNDGYNDSGVRV